MAETLFFITGIMNSVALIIIFLIRKKNLELLQKYGRFYLLLAVPAIIDIFLIFREHSDIRYVVFLGIFLAFLVIEWLYDYKLKIGFRDNWIRNWKWSVPYLAFYYMMNYGFVVMPWKTHLLWGIVMLCLFAVQLVTNLLSHPRGTTTR